jgi:hypothetical protein
LLNGDCEFFSEDGQVHSIKGKWDLIIAHPPCTRLCNSGQRWLYTADCEKIVIENPCGIMSSAYRKPDCTYNPYDFEGETECKKTDLWLKGVSPLKPTRKVPLSKEERTQGIWKAHFGDKKLAWNDPETARLRSQTPIGVAKAMADQWG